MMKPVKCLVMRTVSGIATASATKELPDLTAEAPAQIPRQIDQEIKAQQKYEKPEMLNM